ncbi:transposase [Pseudomonas alloputida]|uniref:Transposase n=2 Tax=Pseudomonas putida group TaxID=136845 RepID=A0A7V8EF10_PSEPU|nr:MULTISPECIES: AAA family ATPase [Pseudomonas]KAF0253648.1 transposase [Pseudomonas putida]MCE0861924.1 transposase [Pseudomonas alloputida]MCE0868004.1 transposase [Pseudomonas alloputida]MCE0891354.1 transposase [Pseudomonas alloputida]MCE0920475.1 transposase [Pseudomonas alloputida]
MNRIIEARFDGYMDIESIRSRVTVRPDPIKDLEALPPLLGAELLAERLKEMYLPNQFSLAFIQEMIGLAYLHNLKNFRSEAEYAGRIFNPPDVEASPICLTGLAGVGKSQTIAALRRAMPPPVELTCDLFEGSIELASMWYASARGKASGKQLLLDFIHGSGHEGRGGNLAKLLVECRRRANRDGVLTVVLDETQHINTGMGASKVTDILLTMVAIGVPTIFVSNYSLGHKLFRRNSEDKQRLLSQPRVMLPEDPRSQDWAEYVGECMRLSDGRISSGKDEFAAELYRSTFGIKRLVVQLLKLAYIECRVAGRNRIEVDDLHKAYRSSAYTTSSKEVEELQLLAISKGNQGGHLDLRCPFDLPVEYKSNVVSFNRTDRDQRVQTKVFDSSATETERSLLRQITQPDEKAPAKAPRRKPLPKATDEDLALAFHRYADSQSPSSPPKKPK